MFGHILGLFLNPQAEWQKFGERSDESIKRLLPYPIMMALLPPIGFYIGTTQYGWSVMGESVTRITPASAIPISVLFYVAIIGAVIFVGGMIHWMSSTFNARSFAIKGVVLTGYACTPVFIAGLFAVYPVWWFDLLLATAACGYAIRLIYLGVPPVMQVPEDRGFLYASAIFMMALVYMAMMLGATVILWEFIQAPVFIN
jgi:hypothetical protein